jgi:hypothetical protein
MSITNQSQSTDSTKRALIVTGAANGLGLAIARRFAADGAKLLLVDCDSAVLSRIGEKDFPALRTFALVKDLAEADAAEFVFAEAGRTIGLVDGLINNAGWSFHKPIQNVTVEEFDRLVAINQRAPFFLAQEFVRQLSAVKVKPVDPVIVNIASVNALVGNPNLAAYSGTKGALAAITRALAVELPGIRVNSISPSAIKTFVTSGLIESGVINPPRLFEDYIVRRFATCEEIAELVAYLCSPAATFVTGANWVIDGGYIAR